MKNIYAQIESEARRILNENESTDVDITLKDGTVILARGDNAKRAKELSEIIAIAAERATY